MKSIKYIAIAYLLVGAMSMQAMIPQFQTKEEYQRWLNDDGDNCKIARSQCTDTKKSPEIAAKIIATSTANSNTTDSNNPIVKAE